MGMIIIFCGVPASGKSTIAEQLRERLEGVEMIVSDDIGSSRYDNIMRLVDEKIGKYDYILVDATFYKKKWREEIRTTVGSRDEVKLVYVHCSLETCIKRNKERENSIPEKAIHIIWNKFDEPESPDVSINTDDTPPDKAAEIILENIR